MLIFWQDVYLEAFFRLSGAKWGPCLCPSVSCQRSLRSWPFWLFMRRVKSFSFSAMVNFLSLATHPSWHLFIKSKMSRMKSLRRDLLMTLGHEGSSSWQRLKNSCWDLLKWSVLLIVFLLFIWVSSSTFRQNT